MDISNFIKSAEKRKKKDSQVKEISIEDHFCDYAKSKGCQAYKLIFLNRKGFPDRTVLCPDGICFFIEFKRKNKPRTPIQTKVRKILMDLGFQYFTCDEIGQAEKHLDNILRKMDTL